MSGQCGGGPAHPSLGGPVRRRLVLDPQVTALVDEHPRLGVECVLRELHIPSSTYYRWRRAEKEPCERRRRDVGKVGAGGGWRAVDARAGAKAVSRVPQWCGRRAASCG